MALQNIGIGNRDDAFYRYKMPRLVTKIEGRGNGIKTNLVNIVDVAKALARPPAYITKFFGCELGAQSKFDEKTSTSIVNGAHETAKLSALLETFIKKYVQCYGCGNPETEVIVTKSQTITLKCAACGFTSTVDMRDKLTTFILKNPAVQKSKKKGLRKAENERLKAGEVLDAEIKRVKREIKKESHEVNLVNKKKGSRSDEEGSSSSSSQVDEIEDMSGKGEEVEWQTDTSARAAEQRVKEQLNAVMMEMVMLSTESEDRENFDVEKKNHGAEHETISVESACRYGSLLKEFKHCLDNKYSADQLAAHLKKLICTGKPQQEAMNAYFEALFNEAQKGLAKEICRKKLYLSKAVRVEYGQALLLGAVEAHYSSKSHEVCKEVAISLKMLYDLDILEEDSILAWYEKGACNEVREKAKPFVDWVQNAESEEE